MSDPGLSRDIRTGSWVVVWRVVGVASNIVWTLVLSRFYGPAVVGIFATFYTVVSVASLAARFGLDRASIRFIGQLLASPDRAILGFASRIRLVVVALAVVVALGLGAAAGPLGGLFSLGSEGVLVLTVAAAAVLPHSLALVLGEQLRAVDAVTHYAFVSFALVPLGAMLALPLAEVWGLPLPPLFAYLGGAAVAVAVGLVQWRRSTADLRSAPVSRPAPRLNDVLPVATHMLLAGSMLLVVEWSDILILSSFRSQDEVGVYSVAARVAMLVSFAALPVASILGPRIAQAWGVGDWIAIRAHYHGGRRWMSAFGLPVAATVFVAAPWLLSLFGSSFVAGSTALRLLAVGHLASMLAGPVGYALDMTGSHRAWQRILWVAGILNIGLNVVMIPRWGAGGAALASLLAMLTWNGLGVAFLLRDLARRPERPRGGAQVEWAA